MDAETVAKRLWRVGYDLDIAIDEMTYTMMNAKSTGLVQELKELRSKLLYASDMSKDIRAKLITT